MPNVQDWKQWELAVHQICGNFHIEPPSQHNLFIGDIRSNDIGGLTIASIQTNAACVSRKKIHGEDGEYCFLLHQRQGVMLVEQEHTQIVLRPGDIALLDSARHFAMRPQGFIEQVSVHLPRKLLEKHLQGDAYFGMISQHNLSGQVLRTLIRQVASQDASLWAHHQDGEALQAALVSLIKPTLSIDSELLAPLRIMAEKFILQFLQDRNLSPRFLAAQLRISIRQLYRLFDDDGERVARYITLQRLRKSEEDLSDTTQGRMSITEIALKWGFYDSAHFSRIFKKHYGMSPRDYRNKHIAITIPPDHPAIEGRISQ